MRINSAKIKLMRKSDREISLHNTRILILVLLAYLSFGATVYHLVEKWSWFDSFYFTVVTVATVGYGDFTPQTVLGKTFTMLYIFIGIALFIAVANSFLKLRASISLNRLETRKASKNGKSK